MLEMPQRSVTRFFIPLIDVLILLFSLSLILMVLDQAEQGKALTGDADLEQFKQIERELERLRAQNADVRALEEQIENLRRQLASRLKDRLAVRVLEIDGKTGRLVYRDPDPVEVDSDAAVKALIQRDKRERVAEKRELYFLILYPRDRASPYPTRAQRDRYDRWFADAAVGYDIPGEVPASGAKP